MIATNNWLEMMESGIETAAVFFDFTKAFVSVPHKPLMEKLQAIGLDYLTNCTHYVVGNGIFSMPLFVISGVLQESVLWPLLFLIFINGALELPLSPKSKLVMYADDILLYRPIRQASDYQSLQQDIETLGKWALNNYLTFNPSKSKAMVFSRKRYPV